jgi:predicted  nucleic acid-binding Zn-ribbon protein
MSDNNPFSLNNIRVHLSEIPAGFSKNLKAFLTRQPDFNDAIHKLSQKQQQRILLLEQQLSQMGSNEDLTQEVQKLQRTVNSLTEQLKTIQQPVINITAQEKGNGSSR